MTFDRREELMQLSREVKSAHDAYYSTLAKSTNWSTLAKRGQRLTMHSLNCGTPTQAMFYSPSPDLRSITRRPSWNMASLMPQLHFLSGVTLISSLSPSPTISARP